EILVERRCLGRTELKVKPGQVGTSNATKPDNLGVLDYAHLRVPLPKDLGASGIFSRGSNRKFPESYFLMRRSNDGFVSATGMFKAAFPYAQAEEEIAEKDYIKNLSDTASEEVAGNVWIHPDQALQLADEYGIRLWIAALLDPEPITHGNDPHIKSPPPYSQSKMANGNRRSRSPEKKQQPQQPPVETRASTRSRRSASIRSESPGATPQVKTPSRPKATPRKSRRGRGTLSRVDEGAAAVEAESVNGRETGSADENVKIEVETTTHQHPASRTTRSARAASEDVAEDEEKTKVNIELPAGNPDLPIPNDTEAMLREARRMVKEAEDLSAAGGGDEGSSSKPSKPKRKAEEMIEDDDEVGLEGPRSGPAAATKRTRVEIKLRKEKIKKRAAVGITASLALGALVPTLAAAFASWV
ncbi:hypothetical protein KC316_g7465, partial [Hortaea werneckii]